MSLIPWWEYALWVGYFGMLGSFLLAGWHDRRLHRKMMERSKQEEQQEPRFKVGDWATLKSDNNNSFEGFLKYGKAYQVRSVHFAYIGLDGTENGIKALFKEEHFDKLAYDPDPPGAREYDEIMQIQDYKDREILSD